MAGRRTKTKEPGQRWLLEAVAVLLAAVALTLGLSLGSHHPTDPSWGVEAPGVEVRNLIGPLGANLSYSFYEVLGFSAWLVPPILAGFAALVMLGHRVRVRMVKIAGALLLLASVACLLEIVFSSGIELRGGTLRAGGYLGGEVVGALAGNLHVTGAALIAATGLLLGLMLLTRISLAEVSRRTGTAFSTVAVGAASAGAGAWKGSVGRIGASLEKAAETRKERAAARQVRAAERAARRERKAEERRLRKERKEAARAEREAARAARLEEKEAQEKEKKERKEAAAKITAKRRRKKARKPRVARTPKKKAAAPPAEKPPAEEIAAAAPDAGPAATRYRLPPTDLLEPGADQEMVDEATLLHNSQVIVAKYAEFSIEGKVIQIHPGPIVTTYEFKPEAGIKYSRITGLTEDLCLALKAESLLIDRIPGKSTVGIEVPNPERQTIHMAEILDSEEGQKARSRMTLALGKTIEGEPYVTDLAKMPHLLIAGSTGSGKSVCINTMISSILFRATPEEVRFILIDPKRLELGLYQGMPHLYTPVVTDPKQAVNALQWAVREMEDRYRRLAETAVRNIDQYNRLVKKGAVPPDGEDPVETLPYLVIVVDELADLMLVTRGGVEESLARLAQMARAVGIHLILSTQRPSVDVLTGVIKANFPSRISFRVSSKVDSRTVLDCNGAEQLLGKGDMLFLPPGTARLVRLHAPLLTEDEIGRLVEFWKEQDTPTYREEVLEPPKAQASGGDEHDDDLYDQAARIVVERQEASVSYLQRRLRIGYARAARLVDLMEEDGLVGSSPETGGKMREVLVQPDYFSEIDSVRAAQG